MLALITLSKLLLTVFMVLVDRLIAATDIKVSLFIFLSMLEILDDSEIHGNTNYMKS